MDYLAPEMIQVDGVKWPSGEEFWPGGRFRSPLSDLVYFEARWDVHNGVP